MSYRRYALDRIVWALVVFVFVLALVFLVEHVFPRRGGDDARYNHYVAQGPGAYLHDIFDRGLGKSLSTGETALEVAQSAAPVTLSLVGWALFYGLLIAVALGLLWDRRPAETRIPGSIFVYLAISVSPIAVEFFIGYWFGYQTGWHLPPIGYADFFSPPKGEPGGALQWAYHLILPGITLGLPIAAIYTRVVRAMARNVRRARAEAAPAERGEAAAAARRTAWITVLRGLLRDAGFLIGAAVLVEQVYNLPGLGRTMILATYSYDLPIMGGVLLFAAALAIGIHLTGNLIGAAFSREWRELP